MLFGGIISTCSQMTSRSQQIFNKIQSLEPILQELVKRHEIEKAKAFHGLDFDKLTKRIDSLFADVDNLKAEYHQLVREEEQERRQEEVFTKAEKKKIRKQVYDDINGHYKKHISYGSFFTSQDILYHETTKFFLALKKASLKDCLKHHRKCVEIEYTMMEDLLENPVEFLVKYDWDNKFSEDGKGLNYINTKSGDTEIIRVMAKHLQLTAPTRKQWLKDTMEIDALIGYWGLNR